MFCEQDDYWMETKLSRIGGEFKKDSDIWYVISNAEFVDQELNSLGTTLWEQRGFHRTAQLEFMQGKQFCQIVNYNITTGMISAVKKVLLN